MQTPTNRNPLYGFTIAPASDPTHSIQFPRVPYLLTYKDRRSVAEQVNLAGDAKQSFLKIVAPDVDIAFDDLSETELDRFRALAFNPTDFYLFQPEISRRIRVMTGIVVQTAGPTYRVTLPHSSYTLASKQVVAAGGASLLSGFICRQLWSEAMKDPDVAPGAGTNRNLFTTGSYDDATETLTLGNNAPQVVADGDRCHTNFDAAGWLVKLGQGAAWNPIPGRSDGYALTLTLEAV